MLISIIGPEGVERMREEAQPLRNESFVFTYIIPPYMADGTYQLLAEYEGESAAWCNFSVCTSRGKIGEQNRHNHGGIDEETYKEGGKVHFYIYTSALFLALFSAVLFAIKKRASR